MKISKSRKSTHSVMAHGGFGMLSITRNGVTIHVPEEWLFNDGRVKKYAVKNIDRMFKKAEAFNSIDKGDVV